VNLMSISIAFRLRRVRSPSTSSGQAGSKHERGLRPSGISSSAIEAKRLLQWLLLACVMCGSAAHGQAYPSKPSRLIVGFVAGGPTDVVARTVAQQLTERLSQPFIVENRPGASGIMGAELVAKAPPDGYTMYFASQTTHAVAPAMYPKVGYDSIRDFATVIRVAHNPLLMVVHPSFPVKTFKDVVGLMKARPGQINFATGGIGSSPHMSMELIKKTLGLDMIAVHYKGDGAAMIDIMGGHVPILNASIGGLLPHVRSGKLRGIAVTSLKRSAMAPEFPTIAESGAPGFEVITWFGILVPAATPKEVITKLNGEVVQVLAQPKVSAQLIKLGFEVAPNTPEQFAAFLKDENVRWGKIVRDLGLKAE
jgi:tripartite-type tricarboxylate transporter receptor subunit TctC